MGIGGSYPVRLYRVSLHVYDAQNLALPWFSHPTLVVMDLPPWVSHEALIGLDVLLNCKTTVDGPAGDSASTSESTSPAPREKGNGCSRVLVSSRQPSRMTCWAVPVRHRGALGGRRPGRKKGLGF